MCEHEGEETDLVAKMNWMLNEMQHMRDEMKAGQEETALKLARSGKHDSFSFLRKGNENQFRFCEDIVEQLQAAAASISLAEKGAVKEALVRARDAITEGIELLSRRKTCRPFGGRLGLCGRIRRRRPRGQFGR